MIYVRDRRESKNSEEYRRRRSTHSAGYECGQSRLKFTPRPLVTHVRAAHEIRQLRPEVGQEPQERAMKLSLGLGFISSEVIVKTL